MISDLAGLGETRADADIVVVGAGTVGLPVAVLLARRGLRVVCLESGGQHQREDHHPLNAVEQLGTRYAGADDGRFRCLGGTSTRWGGALIPFQAADFNPADWPIGWDDLAPHLPEAEALFGLEPGPYADPAFAGEPGPDHVHRLAKWPPFARRNTARLFEGEARTQANLALYLNATLTSLAAQGDGPVRIAARSPGGDWLTVTAPRVIVAAGAIETTRIALLADRENGGIISHQGNWLGRGFSDHLSLAVGEVHPASRARLNRVVGFRFGRGGTMRNLRFELAPDAALRASLPPGFAHIGFESDQPGGFDALRAVFRAAQQRRLPGPAEVLDLARHAPWLARAVWWRFARQRLLFPDGARLALHVVIEQQTDRANRIALSETRRDPFGLPLATIDWRIGAADQAALLAWAETFAQAWSTGPLAALGAVQLYPAAQLSAQLGQSGGIYHPTGSTRMGRDAASGVIDRDLRLFAMPQVQLLSTAAFPTGGGANPTMTLFLLALRCVAQHLSDTARS